MSKQFIKILHRASSKIIRIKEKYQQQIFKIYCKNIGNDCRLCYPIYYYGLENVEIGNNVTIGERTKIRTYDSWNNQHYKFNPIIKIGNNVLIGNDCHISAVNEVIIEDNVLFAAGVYVSDLSHGQTTREDMHIPPLNRPLVSKGSIRICKNVWLGERCVILPGVIVGEGAIIGANAVVSKDVPPFSVVAGVPAKIIKHFEL